MSYRRPDKLRQVAVLVASLDPALAESLLSGLPPSDAQRVRELADELDEIDPEEQADVLDQLRRGAPTSDVDYEDTVEIETSLAEQIDRLATAGGPHVAEPEPLHERLARADALAIARRLSRESPQTVAVILLRLSQEQAAAVFDDLPIDLKPAVLERLSTSIPADEQTVVELENQIAQWIDQDQRAQTHRAAGSELARVLKTRTPAIADDPPHREVFTPTTQTPFRWPLGNWQNASRQAAEVEQPPTQVAEIASRVAEVASPVADAASQRLPTFRIPLAAQQTPVAAPPPEVQPETSRYDPAELEQLDDRTLLAVLCEVDARSAQLALHAGSARLAKRVLRRMPRPAARRLRQQLRDLGPVQIREVDEAQQQLLRLARAQSEG